MTFEDEVRLLRALTLATKGRGLVEPNPLVGCVIALAGKIIAEGWHRGPGLAHAEVDALNNLAMMPCGATAYVNLEPCYPFRGKRTGSCAAALIDSGIKRIVVGAIDPNPAVNGRGIAMLRKAGVSVELAQHSMDSRARQLNAPFSARMVLNRPYVTLKWAQTRDRCVAGPGGKRLRITNMAATAAVHRLRGRSDAILVGVNTVMNDDPLLTARGVILNRKPFRAVLDSNLRTPPACRLIATARDSSVSMGTLIYCSEAAARAKSSLVSQLTCRGAQVVPVGACNGRVSLAEVLADLAQRDVTHVLVEGGPTVASAFIATDLADRAWVFRSDQVVRNYTAPLAPSIDDWREAGVMTYDRQTLVELLNPRSKVYFGAFPSADLHL